MSDVLRAWIKARLGVPGTLAGAAQAANGALCCQSADEAVPLETVERIMNQLSQFQPQLAAAIPSPRFSTWRFEQGRINCFFRPDGVTLVWMVRAGTEAEKQLEKLSADFFALDLDAGA